MTISYNWLSEYLQEIPEPKSLSNILTSIGLEVEKMETFEAVKGSFKGLVIGEVLNCEKHPNADKLTLTTVKTGPGEPLKIVCGAPNVAPGQKVVVAPVGSTIYPINGEPVTMKAAKIRGAESQGMICAEDEIGLGDSHEGIMVLADDAKPGEPVSSYFNPYQDIIYEIGLTPNRMDAMSHLGVARDVAAYLTYHSGKEVKIKSPFNDSFKPDAKKQPIDVVIENKEACKRYAAILIKGVHVSSSPKWLQDRLSAVGVRSINNIVDITNYILHETGQPLHAFDAAEITSGKVVVKNLPEGTGFMSLDGKERKLSSEDLMICNADEPMCIAGVFGGLKSGVKESTTDIFLESAWFAPASIRKSSFRHGLRTDAATRFEKGIDISNCVNVLKRAALIITETAGGSIASGVTDIYPGKADKTEIELSYDYLKKLSGKEYTQKEVKTIFHALQFDVAKEDSRSIRLSVPYHKTDITIPADLVEELLRIDGYDNVAIPAKVMMTPAVQQENGSSSKEKISSFLSASGFMEIMTNSITNSAFYVDDVLSASVKMLNSLSAELDIMRPSLLESGLQALAYNLNRRQSNLRFFEFGRSYRLKSVGNYEEEDHLVVYITGKKTAESWQGSGKAADYYYCKGLSEKILKLVGGGDPGYRNVQNNRIEFGSHGILDGTHLVEFGAVSMQMLKKFDIKQPVFYIDFNWHALISSTKENRISFRELPKQLPVQRDLSMLIPKGLQFEEIRKSIDSINLKRLQKIELFDVFESEKLGKDRKSMAISVEFLDEEKTLTDKEIDGMVNRIIQVLSEQCQAEIRK